MIVIKNAEQYERAEFCTHHIFDKKLSAKAKGILSFLLAMPPGWNCSIEEIVKNFADGTDSVRNALCELETRGYLKKEKLRENGRFTGFQYEVYEKPTAS